MRIISSAVFVFSALVSFSQITSDFEFTNAQNAGSRDTVSITLTNDYSIPQILTIGESVVYFSDTVFMPLQSQIQLDAGESKDIEVVMYSEHNMNHKYFLEIKTEDYGSTGIQLVNEVSYTQARYNNTYNKTGEDLKAALKVAAQQGFNSLSYNVARDRMYASIDNVSGDVTCAYTGRVATFNTRPGANSNSFNCEHSFPQGFFNSDLPMRSDIFHLFPTDVNANSQRGNLPFGTVTNPSWSEGGSKKNSSRFEPRDVQKGKTARGMMYFVIRYQDYNGHFAAQENILRQWNENFGVDASEAQRNNAIEENQGNRNPFIDHPRFAERFTSFTSNGNLSTAESVELSNDSLVSAQGNTVYAILRNTGTESINLQGFNLSNSTGFTVVEDELNNDGVLEPGEGLRLTIVMEETGQAETGTYEIQTDAAQGSFSIYLRSEAANSFGEKVKEESEVVLFPNPSTDFVRSSERLSKVSIVNVAGKAVVEVKSAASKWSIIELPAGLYYFNGRTQNGTLIQSSFVKE